MGKRSNTALYRSQFDDIPDDLEGRLKLLMDSRYISRIKSATDIVIKDTKRIKRTKLTFTWYTEPHPSRRPRANLRGNHVRMYVPLAAETKLDFKEFFAENFPGFKPIRTPMRFYIKSYLKTPVSMPRHMKILAELGVLRPWGRVGDCDNLLKTYTDCTVDSLIADDDLIDEMRSEKFYSIKPRVEFTIIYDSRFPKGLEPKDYEEVTSDVRS